MWQFFRAANIWLVMFFYVKGQAKAMPLYLPEGSDKFPGDCPNATRSSLIGQSGIRIAPESPP
jgi:hypothetical protein